LKIPLGTLSEEKKKVQMTYIFW